MVETATARHMKVLFYRLEKITSYEIDQSGKESNLADYTERKITGFKLEYMVHYNIVWYKFHFLTACAVNMSYEADEIYLKLMDMWDDTHIIKKTRWLTHFKGMIKICRTIFRFLFCMVVKLDLSHSGKNIH
jgi:hypothetical protein